MSEESAHTGIAPKMAFAVAWVFLVVSASFGVILRLQSVYPIEGLNYGYLLHAHSHLGFLGWVFNAFFALTLLLFSDPRDERFLRALFVVLQIANVGMLIAFPLEGYARESIIFSTLHMAGAGVFAWKLWRRNRAAPAALGYLGAALVFMLMSGAGPLVLGPLAAADLRDSPWYSMAIYWYLHFQYNGWFVFFLLAGAVQRLQGSGNCVEEQRVRRAFPWLITGCVGTFALSALWMEPPVWVFAVAGVAGLVQLTGTVLFLRALPAMLALFVGHVGRTARFLAGLALGAFVLKNLLQLAAAWPDLAALVNHRYSVVAFLHLVFLGVVMPMLIAWAVQARWLWLTTVANAGLWLFLAGAVATGAVLASMPLAISLGWPPWPRTSETLLAGALAMAVGIAALGFGFWNRRLRVVKTAGPPPP